MEQVQGKLMSRDVAKEAIKYVGKLISIVDIDGQPEGLVKGLKAFHEDLTTFIESSDSVLDVNFRKHGKILVFLHEAKDEIARTFIVADLFRFLDVKQN